MALTSTYQLSYHTAALLAYYDLEQCMDDDAYSSYTVVDNLHAEEEQDEEGGRTSRAHGKERRNAWALPPPPDGPLWVRDDPGANTGADRDVSAIGEPRPISSAPVEDRHTAQRRFLPLLWGSFRGRVSRERETGAALVQC